MNDKKQQLASNTLILAIGTVCTKCMSFLFIPLFSRWLTTSEYGDFDVYTSYVALIIPLVTLAVSEALFRFLVDEVNEERKKEIISNTAIISVIGCTLVALVIFILSWRSWNFVVISFILYFLSDAFYTYMVCLLRGMRKLNIYAYTGAINLIVCFVMVFILVRLNGYGLEGMLLAYACGYCITGIIILGITKFWKYFYLKTLNRNIILEVINYSLPMIPNAVSWWIVNVSDRTIIKIFLGSSFNGLYALAYKIPSLCTTLFSVIHISWQENISLTINEPDRDDYINEIFNQIVQSICSIALPVISINYFLFSYIFAKEYFDGIYQVPILMCSVIANVMAQFIGGIFVALKVTKWNGVTTTISAILNLVVHITLISKIGLYAASCSTVISFVGLFVIRYVVLYVYYDIKITFSRRTIICIMIYFVFALISSSYDELISILLFIIGSVIFFYINKDMILSMLKRRMK